jgi:hypothetical protein
VPRVATTYAESNRFPGTGSQRVAPPRPEHARLPRSRRHTKRSLACLRRATSAHQRRGGIGPGPMPSTLAAQMPCWLSRAHMLRVIDGLTGQPHVHELCRAKGVALATWKAATINDVLDADDRTGRGLSTSQVVAGARLQRGDKQIQRVRDINVQLGILVEYYRGRELSGAERHQLLADHPGNKQRGIPNAYAMGVFPPRQRRRISTPRPGRFAQVQTNVYLPRRGYVSLSAHLPGQLPITAADASEAKATPPAPPPRRKRHPGLALAHEMLAHPGLRLFTGVPAVTLAGQLAPFHRGGWHGLDLADVLIQSAHAMRIDPTRTATNPHGALKTLLSQIEPIIDVVQAPAQPCRRADCDHGWILVGPATVAKCPDCPASVRGALVADDEPPF